MAALSIWACLPLLLVASVISFASAARILPSDTDDHSSISTRTTNPSDDLDWLPVSRVKRKLSIAPSQHGTDDDNFSVPTSMDNAAISYPTPAPIRLFEKGEGVMSDEDVWKNIVVDGKVDHTDSLFQHSSDKEINEIIIMDDLEDVGMDSSNTDGGFDDDECDTLLCGWGWNRGSNHGWGNEGSGTNGGGGGSGGIGSIGGGGGSLSGGGDSNGWSWGDGSTGGDSGGIGWNWGGGGSSGGGHIGRGGISIGSSGGSGRNSWHWGWHWGGGGSKVAVSNDHNPNIDASGMSTNSATAPAPMSN